MCSLFSVSVRAAIDCGPLEVMNGFVNTPIGTTLLSLAFYSCNAGFRLSGNVNVRTCLENGQWSGIPPTCERKYNVSYM